VASAYANPGLGFDPGVPVTEPVDSLTLAGAAIPTLQGELDLAFLVFATATRADAPNAALDRSVPPPADGNGASDVFVAALVNREVFVNGSPQPAAFTQGLATVFRDDRCTRCHSFHYPGGWREMGHRGNLQPGSNAGCDVCHGSSAVLVSGSSRPPTIHWEAPDADQTASQRLGQTQDFRGKTDKQLYDLAMSKQQPGHFLEDDKILWALAHGRVPFRGLAQGGTVPIALAQWDALVTAWARDNKKLFSTDGAVLDVALASQRAAGGGSGDGASLTPSAAFVPNPDYQPSQPERAPAGWVLVAFASDARDLVAAATSGRQIYRAMVEVRIARDGAVDLVARPDLTTLVSAAIAGGGGNGDSFAPAIGDRGQVIAFTSRATDLVAGFVDGNGTDGSDVFVREERAGATSMALVSRSAGVPGRGGDGSSRSAAAAPSGGTVVAFTSQASDLVAGDGNRRSDAFFARVDAGAAVVERVSVDSNGNEAAGADAEAASVWVDPAGVVWVAFESTSGGLDVAAQGGGTPSAYLARSTGAPRVLRLGRPSTGATRAPRIGPDGKRVLFLSAAPDLDSLQPDRNGVEDLFSFNFEAYRGSADQVGFARHSLAVTGIEADGKSDLPAVSGFVTPDGSLQSDSVVAFTTTATNLGRSPNSDVVLQFLIDRANPRTSASFTAVPTRGVAPHDVQFSDQSLNATAWEWTFGDGEGSVVQNPQHTYRNPGDYTVRLTVTGPGGTSMLERPNYITVTPRPRTWQDIYNGAGPDGLNRAAACTGCHGEIRQLSMLDLRSEDIGYDNLVGVASQVCAGRVRVRAGDVNASAMLDLLTNGGCYAGRVHPGGTASPELLAALREWIQGGALRR